MNAPRCDDIAYLNVLIAAPGPVSCTEAARVQPKHPFAPAHDAFTRLLNHREPNPEILWDEAQGNPCAHFVDPRRPMSGGAALPKRRNVIEQLDRKSSWKRCSFLTAHGEDHRWATIDNPLAELPDHRLGVILVDVHLLGDLQSREVQAHEVSAGDPDLRRLVQRLGSRTWEWVEPMRSPTNQSERF